MAAFAECLRTKTFDTKNFNLAWVCLRNFDHPHVVNLSAVKIILFILSTGGSNQFKIFNLKTKEALCKQNEWMLLSWLVFTKL